MGRGFSVAKATPLSAVAARQQTCTVATNHRIGGLTNMAATIHSYI